MNALAAFSVFIEFKENSVHVLAREQGLDLPLQRDPTGVISAACAAELRGALGAFRGRKVVCAIPARGVSLRVLSLPASGPEEIARILPLQIEAQFPVGPGELAWGFSAMNGARAKPGFQDILVAAVKRDILGEYRELLASAGLDASFTIAALARCGLAQSPPAFFNLLDVDHPRSEMVSFEASGHARVRALDTDQLAASQLPGKLYITGRNGLADQIAARLQLNGSSEVIELGATPGGTAANLGLRELSRATRSPLLLAAPEQVLKPSAGSEWKWPVLAGALLLALLAVRVLEPLLQKPRFERRLAEIQRYRDSLPAIERELSFLQYIQTNQPPYLDSIAALAEAAPRGTRFDSLAIAGRGDLNVRGSMQNAQAAGEFRSKLISAGLFSKIILEEQTPVPNQQKINFRLSAQIAPAADRKQAAPGTASTNQTNNAKSN